MNKAYAWVQKGQPGNWGPPMKWVWLNESDMIGHLQVMESGLSSIEIKRRIEEKESVIILCENELPNLFGLYAPKEETIYRYSFKEPT